MEPENAVVEETVDNLLTGENGEVVTDEVKPLEDWQKSDEDLEAEAEAEAKALAEESEEDGGQVEGEDDKSKPVKFLKEKKKLKRRLQETDDELEKLRRENEELKKGVPSTNKAERPKRPKEYDFDTDEEFEAAQDKYDDDIIEYRLSYRDTKKQESTAQEAASKQIQDGVDSHFERAEKLMETSGISPEKYDSANITVRKAIDTLAPGRGDFVTDYLIAQLGEGSEKVFYHLGVNKASLATLTGLLTADPSGVRAGIFLGGKLESLGNPTPKKSKAPAPAPSLQGNNTPGGEAKMKKDYDSAMKSGNIQKAMDIRTDARRTHKINTGKW